MDCPNHIDPGSRGETTTQKAYTIGGVPIIFPYKAYPSQITMMDRIVKCLNKKHNCLLESPTGSGKSLALLCASIAWLKKTTKEFREMEEILYKNLNTYGVYVEDNMQPAYDDVSKFNFEKYKFSNDKISSSKTKAADHEDSAVSDGKKKLEFLSPKSSSDASSPSIKDSTSLFNSEKYKFKKSSSDDTLNVKMKISTTENRNSCNSQKLLSELPSPKEDISSFSPNIKDSPSVFGNSENNNVTSVLSKKRGITFIDDDMEDFQPIKKNKQFTDLQELNSTPTSPQNNDFTAVTSPEQAKSNCMSKLESSNNITAGAAKTSKMTFEVQTNSTLPEKLPKIYFGTRTHKQIGQIIRELKKTPYKDVKMTILSSRERTCIHPKVSKSRNKNEGCDELINREGGPGCKYYSNVRRSACYLAPSSAYDLEDFVSICKRKQVCPYYGARELLQAAEIIFCPYNYLVDPLIRSALSIFLKGNIVIMDEAHNIEDSAREAASSSISVAQVQEAIADILNISQLKQQGSEPYLHIAKVLENLKRWLENSQDLNDYVSFDSSSKVWSGDDMIAILDYVGLGPDTFPTFQNMYTKINQEESENEKDKETELPKLSGQTHICLKNLNVTLNYLYKEKMLFAPDYRCVVIKSKAYSEETSVVPFSKNSKRKSFSNMFEITLNFWCLNPSVAFSDMKDIHSLIVASGTLAPLTSFQSELGIPFHLSLEANHVVSRENLWVGTIAKGPSNNSLNGTFHNASTYTFQDDIGNLVLEVCTVIPHGVLCFLPSYGMLDKLVNRWQITGLWDKLWSKKRVLCEPRRANEDFQQVMEEFYEAVKDSEANDCVEVKGALFLAVCRGKVSEGLDFADNNARAVITIGIPFPNIKDAQVDLKKKYNDIYSSKKQIVTGTVWYEMQAFRALNQALGRCIRHKNDFGALIIVDERFQKYDRYVSALSKWIKKEIKHYSTFYDALSSLSTFAEHMGLKNASVTE